MRECLGSGILEVIEVAILPLARVDLSPPSRGGDLARAEWIVRAMRNMRHVDLNDEQSDRDREHRVRKAIPVTQC